MVSKLEKVLCIDDDTDILEILKLCLGSVGKFSVCTATSGKQGVAEVRVSIPDLILLDVMMPVMDGLHTFQEFRKNKSLDNTPIIFMTARIQPSEVDHYMQLGAAGVISKPFEVMKLPSQIQAIWEVLCNDKRF